MLSPEFLSPPSRLTPEECEKLFIHVMTTRMSPEREAKLAHNRRIALEAFERFVSFDEFI